MLMPICFGVVGLVISGAIIAASLMRCHWCGGWHESKEAEAECYHQSTNPENSNEK